MKPNLSTHEEYVNKMQTTLKNVSKSGAGQTQSRNQRVTYNVINKCGNRYRKRFLGYVILPIIPLIM